MTPEQLERAERADRAVLVLCCIVGVVMIALGAWVW